MYVIAYIHIPIAPLMWDIPYSDAAELTVYYAFFDFMTH